MKLFNRFAWYISLGCCLPSSCALADFVGAYSLTSPGPAPGSYSNTPNGTPFGQWTLSTPASGEFWVVSTALAPTTLSLQVGDAPGVAPGPAEMGFSIVVPTATTISFDYVAAYGLPGEGVSIIEFLVNGTAVGAAGPGLGSFSTAVLTGDQFAFFISATQTNPGGVTKQAAITVTNFVPEPSSAWLTTLAAVGFFKRRRIA